MINRNHYDLCFRKWRKELKRNYILLACSALMTGCDAASSKPKQATDQHLSYGKKELHIVDVLSMNE
ncbi:hypothetical protein [Fictibacillus gelatini]|uniref:hypothetical protein n=1 Tax=Fictibacillus gelatini TaxID=225985 RepID=UPI00047DF5AF|nr:hypothetical protein [Fictibacillus gelatini]